MRRDRYFYTITSFVMVLLLLTGFKRFFFEGKEASGKGIPDPILALVIIHGVSLTIWVVLFFVQSVLIAAKNRALHMKLGWATAADALVVSISGPLVAISAPRISPGAHLFGMTYSQFILPMLTEITAFTVFVALGIFYRKKAAVHRSMMLLATLSIISGATARTDFISGIFGSHIGWVEFLGPVFCLGAVILIFRTITTRSFDKWFAAGFAGLSCTYLAAMYLAVGDSWSHIALRITHG